jgi:hypothetical protein
MSLKESNKQKINLPLQHFISAALDFGLKGRGAGGGGALIDARDVPGFHALMHTHTSV